MLFPDVEMRPTSGTMSPLQAEALAQFPPEIDEIADAEWGPFDKENIDSPTGE